MKQVSLAGLEVSRLGRVSRIEENAAAGAVELTGEQLRRLSALDPPAGDRYPDMSAVNR
jgi:diketogulonate reductase-like aldo/keto reductase